eukprot:765244-Hanusia_phi.AAC.2
MGRTPYCEWRTIRRLERRGEEESFFHGQEDDESPEESGDFRSRFSSSEYVRRLAPEFAVMVEKEQRKQKIKVSHTQLSSRCLASIAKTRKELHDLQRAERREREREMAREGEREEMKRERERRRRGGGRARWRRQRRGRGREGEGEGGRGARRGSSDKGRVGEQQGQERETGAGLPHRGE